MFSPELRWIQAGLPVREKGSRGNEVKVMSSSWPWARPLPEPRSGLWALEAGTRKVERSPNARGRLLPRVTEKMSFCKGRGLQ